eukprot:TRINITY_DN2713_c0_g1_i3.p1 TRINITY_DN2713_c0_g1~~TRINITY_DN2713_c0_g1_i3.p1  ORF type:complete len:118 (-),score=27.95 TRINITY_DN2713_c0_g1_i3:79-405(-)
MTGMVSVSPPRALTATFCTRPPFLRRSAWIKDAAAALSAATPTVLEALLKLLSGTVGAELPRRAYELLPDGLEMGACMLTAKAAIAAEDARKMERRSAVSLLRRALQK